MHRGYNVGTMTTSNITIGQRIQTIRHERHLSVADLARAAELTENTIYRIEREDRRPRADTLRAIARALNVTSDTLLGISDAPRDQGPAIEFASLPLLVSPAEEEARTMVPTLYLPEDVPEDALVAVHPDEDAPGDLEPEDLVVAARDVAWEDGDLIVIQTDDAYLVRRGLREPSGLRGPPAGPGCR